MAELRVESDALILELSAIEKAESVHGDLHVPLSAVTGADVVDDAHEFTRIRTGFKVGMRAPGMATVATVRGGGKKMFIAVHRDTPRAVRVTLQGNSYDEWIVGVPDPEAVIAQLNLGPGS